MISKLPNLTIENPTVMEVSVYAIEVINDYLRNFCIKFDTREVSVSNIIETNGLVNFTVTVTNYDCSVIDKDTSFSMYGYLKKIAEDLDRSAGSDPSNIECYTDLDQLKTIFLMRVNY